MKTSSAFPRHPKPAVMTRRQALFGLAMGAATVASAAGTTPAHAQNLESARAAGQIGERRNGYLGVVQNGPGVDGLVQSINAQRRAHYQSIATTNGVPLSAVEAQAAETIINRLPSGAFYEGANGQWVRR